MTARLALLPVGAALAAAACGGPSYSTASAHGAQVGVRHTKLGDVLVDGRGRTLYEFEKDKGPMSTCYGACASVWPPLSAAGRPVAGHGVSAAQLRTGQRHDGRLGVTYAGHPLYLYAGDTQPGDLKGQGLDQFGAKWYVLAPSGRKVDDD
jgi:predicted lipoprotein with Yx(FWY)xxD motif